MVWDSIWVRGVGFLYGDIGLLGSLQRCEVFFNIVAKCRPLVGDDGAADIEGTPPALNISHNDGFFEMRTAAKGLFTLFDYEQFVTRAEYGYVYINNIDNLPLSLQLLTGGSQTIRGFNYESIGPAHQLFVGSGEFRQRIYKQFYTNTFYDFGNVQDQNLFQQLQESLGVGALYRSPIGVIEFDLAWRISDPPPHHIHFVFNLGPEL